MKTVITTPNKFTAYQVYSYIKDITNYITSYTDDCNVTIKADAIRKLN